MSNFAKHDGMYGVSISTDPRSVLLRLELSAERIEDFDAAPYSIDWPNQNPSLSTVRTQILEGTDEANREHGTTFHPQLVCYAVEDKSEDCDMLRRAAFEVVMRLAERGDEGYAGLT